ncbi:MAG TPA: DMT family transporter [Acidimicrobiales bacterium]|nr:DMT family transporter [Acidimicrobiales bacterium]
MAYLLAVMAAFANAMTTILQRLGVETAPAEATMRWRLISYAVRRKVWLAGFAMLVAGFLLQFAALHYGGLSRVQPILTLELPFLVAILGLWFRHHLGWREWVGSLGAAAGLASFLVLASPGGGTQLPDLSDWSLVSISCVGAATIAVLLTRVGPVAWQAAMFGVSAAIAFAFCAALMKEMNLDIQRGWSTVFLHWPPYALAGAGLAGVFLCQNAFHAGPVTASQSMLVIVDPLVSIALGVALFGDRLATAGGRVPGEALSLLMLFGGVFWLARSPLVANVRSEGQQREHLLSHRRQQSAERAAMVKQ